MPSARINWTNKCDIILGVNPEALEGTAANNESQDVPSTMTAASMPWAFTQHQPLSAAEFIREAERRGLSLRPPILRELHRQRLLIPFVYVSNRQVGPVPAPIESEPVRGGTYLQYLRHARDRGRLSDLAATPFRSRLRFDDRRTSDPQRWWNGMLYSWYQLLAVPEIQGLLHRLKGWRTPQGTVIARLPEPGPILRDRTSKLRTIAVALTALEARYLPKLDREWLQVINADLDEWRRYRDGFDPIAVGVQLGYSVSQTSRDAEWLLSQAHSLDPVGDSWSHLMRRAPSRAWEEIKGTALSAIDYRIAAEVLLLFYEDLVDRGQAEPLPDIPRTAWHPLHERLSHRERTLDEDLMHLGISPHPRVVLAVEGETEQDHVPRIWKELDYPDAPELMRLLVLGGVDKDLEKVAALAAAPLVGGRAPSQQQAWLLIKPPTRLFIAADPEGKYFAPQNVDKTRAAILGEIQAVLRAQGVENPNPAELDELLEIRTWSASCYEFAHFTDEELADGIMAVHDDINGWTKGELVEALGYWRDKKKDIKRVWLSGRWDEQQRRMTEKWDYEVSKTKLAEALWPMLKANIDRCLSDPDAPVPEIAQVIRDTYALAQKWRYTSFALSEKTSTDSA